MRRTLHPALWAAALFAVAAGCASTPTINEVAPDPVVLVSVPGGVAASSSRHGPFFELDGSAAGFSHDELGAALAATHLGPRVTPAAPADVVEVTLTQQCWGDVAAARERLATVLPRPDAPPREDLIPDALYFRVIAGDPRGDHVVVSLLADTAQARTFGGYSRVDATLRRHNDDWQLRVPARRPSLHPDTTGYELLGPTP